MDRCEPIVPSLYLRLQRCLITKDNASCHRHATTVRGPALEARRRRRIIGRCHVALHGRPSSSFDCDCQRRNSAAPYIGNCVFRRLEKFCILWPAYKSPP